MANINSTVLAIFFINICCVNIIYFIKIFNLAIKGKGVKMKFNVGDRVKIISRERMRYAAGRNSSGLMDKYGDQVMTIINASSDNCYGGVYRMKEDNRDWHWYEHMIDGLADEFEIKISQDDLMNFLT